MDKEQVTQLSNIAADEGTPLQSKKFLGFLAAEASWKILAIPQKLSSLPKFQIRMHHRKILRWYHNGVTRRFFMCKFLSVLMLSCCLCFAGCANLKLTPEQQLAINTCESMIHDTALGPQCLGQITSGSSAQAIVINCAISFVLKAMPACADIIPTFLTVFQTKDFGQVKWIAAEEQQTVFGKDLKAKITKALDK